MAKEQARIKADNEFLRLLVDEQSAIAPRVDAEIALEHKKLVEERRLATEAQLKALTLEEERALVRTAAARLGMELKDDDRSAKRVKVDQHKARPAPITPRERASKVTAPVPPPDRDEQKTPTPPKDITTVTFKIKTEPSLQPTFVTPSMPSVIRDAVALAQTLQLLFATPSTPSVIHDAVNIAQDVVLTLSLRGSESSIHNEANQMSIDPERLDLANIFPPGIPPLPTNVSLPPAMSHTPQFGGAEAHEDGVAPLCSPESVSANTSDI
ncbi:hypothetical protein V8E53_005968 [Lactarius tabidus]